MDKLAALRLFVETVNAGGFSPAARRLGIATSSVTRAMDALEQQLGVTLLNRSTRQVTVNEAGQAYYARALAILEALAEADALVADRGEQARGPLHVSLPVEFARHLILPHLSDFLARHPGLELTLTLSDEVVDLLSARVDLSIRLGTVVRSDDVVMRGIGQFQRWLVASPAYLRQRGEPKTPAALAEHECLRLDYGHGNARQQWRFCGDDGERQEVGIRGALRSNNADTLRQAALGGSGVALLGDWLVREDVAAGRLVRLFAGHRINPDQSSSAISALYLPGQRASARIGAFIAFVEERLATRA
ncbi:LysR family transcriptional regulator [Pseudomonas citronellolis]|uniref:LysR family transcriptional regulator n=1 Tax=Pseudomonas citronellolis TaxID=53408 RepID=UPI0023E44CD3|nr:LysR family transcriptional regulator [Pseudomonas citronellolis]MDF3936843.1 LysR family transcriptional regulator [Pseudomonas citronellolis]